MAHDLKDINEKMNILCNEYVDEKGLEPNCVDGILWYSRFFFRFIISSLKLKPSCFGTFIDINCEYAYAVKYVLQEFFPSSEISFKNNRDGVGNSNNGSLTFNINQPDVLVTKELIDKYNKYWGEKIKKFDDFNKQKEELENQISKIQKQVDLIDRRMELTLIDGFFNEWRLESDS